MATTTAHSEGLPIQMADSELQLMAAGDRVQFIPLDEISFSSTNPRKHINQDELESLAQNILINGLIQPITVRKAPAALSNEFTGTFTYEVVAGERRLRAHIILRERGYRSGEKNFSSIPSIVREVSDEDLLDLQITENLQREDLTPLDWAAAYRARVDLEKKKQGEGEGAESSAVQIVAARFGKSASVIYQAMQLLNLIPEAQQMLRDRRMNKNHGIDCARLEPEEQDAYVEEFQEREKLNGGTPSVRDMRDWIEVMFGEPEPEKDGEREELLERGAKAGMDSQISANRLAPIGELRGNVSKLENDKQIVTDGLKKISDEDRAKLKRFEDAIAGRKLSGTAAFQINEAIHGFGKIGGYDEGDKLNANGKRRLQEVCDEMRARGITPAETLLTEFQQAAQKKSTGNADLEQRQATIFAEAEQRRKNRLETIRNDARRVFELNRTGALIIHTPQNKDLIAEALFDSLDFDDVNFICELMRWTPCAQQPGLECFSEHIREQYYKNWARDHESFLVTAAALAISAHADMDRERFMVEYFGRFPAKDAKPAAKSARSPLGKKNDAKLAKVAPAKATPNAKPVKRELSSAELASLPVVKKSAVHKPAKKAAKKSAKKGGRR